MMACFGTTACSSVSREVCRSPLEALHHDVTLTDATAYNIQFVGAHPILVDTKGLPKLSFEHLLVRMRNWIEKLQPLPNLIAEHIFRIPAPMDEQTVYLRNGSKFEGLDLLSVPMPNF